MPNLYEYLMGRSTANDQISEAMARDPRLSALAAQEAQRAAMQAPPAGLSPLGAEKPIPALLALKERVAGGIGNAVSAPAMQDLAGFLGAAGGYQPSPTAGEDYRSAAMDAAQMMPETNYEVMNPIGTAAFPFGPMLRRKLNRSNAEVKDLIPKLAEKMFSDLPPGVNKKYLKHRVEARLEKSKILAEKEQRGRELAAARGGVFGKAEKPRLRSDDLFAWSDSETGYLVKELKAANQPLDLHTGSDLFAYDDYLEAIPEGSTINVYLDAYSGAPHPMRLLKAASKAKASGKVNIRVYGKNGENVIIPRYAEKN